MIPDIFSSFDPSLYTSVVPSTSIFLLLTFLLILILNRFSNLSVSRIKIPRSISVSTIISQLSRTNRKSLKGLSSVVTSLFILIILTNLIGLIPYSFSLSRQLIFTLSLGLPIWLRIIISRFSFNPRASTAHFLPDGAPEWLNPFLVLIETSRVLVRPLTLSFRLAANITAGHIVIGLIRIYLSQSLCSSIISSTILTSLTSFYILFEVAICLIQAYIFCLLISLYRDDHA